MEHETIQYRLNLPNALHAISPTLAALHASRVAALHPEIAAILAPSHCLTCGVYHFSGDYPTPFMCASRKRKCGVSSRPKSFRRRCHSCGFSIHAPTSPSLDHSSVPISVPVPVIQRTNGISRPAPPTDTPRRTTKTTSTTLRGVVPPTLPQRSESQPKMNDTKSSTLKDILSRDRQREDIAKVNKQKKQGHDGLVAFLKQL